MPKISKVIETYPSLGSEVRLVENFTNSATNRSRMERYSPIKSHRQAFTALANAIKPMGDRRILLTGSYGTGKSHLMLMFANYLSLKNTDPEMKKFFENWSMRDPDGANYLSKLRTEGRYMVALGDYGKGKDFDEMILDAIEEAIEREGVTDLALDNHYKEAVRQIDYWEVREKQGEPSGVFKDFKSEISNLGANLDSLKADLNDHEAIALGQFKEAYHKALGRDFGYSKDNLVAIIEDLVSHTGFKKRFKGLAILSDEFGYILKENRIDIDVFQRFAEMCRDGVDSMQLIFVGTGHQSFDQYAAGKMSQSDFSVAQDRIKEVSLESEEIEQIIASLMEAQKDTEEWKDLVEPNRDLFARLARDAKDNGLFENLIVPDILEKIIVDIFPMHPMSTYCLVRMSIEISSNARSVFRFFSEESSGSYLDYINNEEIVVDDRLNLYPAEMLFEYFDDEIKPENTGVRESIRNHIRNFHASLDKARKVAHAEQLLDLDPRWERVLRLLLVYKISNVIADQDNLAFGYYCATKGEVTNFKWLLDSLVKKKILFKSATGVFEFRRSDAIDFESIIMAYLADERNKPSDLAKDLTNLVKMDSLIEAKNYNQRFGEDKRFLRLFANPNTLNDTVKTEKGVEINYFQKLEKDLKSVSNWKEKYDGVLVYVICESIEDIHVAKKASKENSSDLILLGITQSPIPVFKAITQLMAAESIEDPTSEIFSDMSLQDRARFKDDILGDENLETGAVGQFVKVRKRYLDSKELTWYAKGGKVFVQKPMDEYEPADELADSLFKKRNKISHVHLNRSHPKRFGKLTDTALNDAVDRILKTMRPIEIDHGVAEGRGEIRYLRSVLEQTGVLRQVNTFRGNIAEYQIEPSAEKFADKLPALADMIARIRNISYGKNIIIRELVEDFSSAPYGQGPAALSLFLACIVRYFGDELRIQLQPGLLGYTPIDNSELIISLVEQEYANAVFERRSISDNEKELIDEIFSLFTDELSIAAKRHTVNEAWGVISKWSENLTNFQRSLEIYPEDSSAHLLLDILQHSNETNPFEFILDQLKSIYGLEVDDLLNNRSLAQILKGLKNDKALIESRTLEIQDELLQKLMEPFHPTSNQYADYKEAIHIWYSNLGEEQKNEDAIWYQENAAIRSILRSMRILEDIENTFLVTIPYSPGMNLGLMNDWRRDKSEEYIELFNNAIKEIESHRFIVPEPIWNLVDGNSEEVIGGYRVTFRKKIFLEIASPDKDIKVRVIDNVDDDPRTATQYKDITKKEKLAIEGDKILKFVSVAADGAFGNVIQISFENEETKFKPRPSLPLPGIDDEYKFNFPPDKDAVQILIEEIINSALEKGSIKKKEIKSLIEDVLSKYQE